MRPSSAAALAKAPPAAGAGAEPYLQPERAQDGPAVDALMRRAFGPGHFAKTSERLREGNALRRDLSFCAWSQDDRLLGAVRLWPVRAGGVPILFLGPIGVDVAVRSRGLAARLIAQACEAADAGGHAAIALVGAPALFEPLGFSVVPPGHLILPGPVDPRRLLWRVLRSGAEAEIQGPLKIAPDLATPDPGAAA
jgi:predicted N-acetyltransferase YhbS